MKNVHMQTSHRKLDVVLAQILRYNCSETDYSFCEDSPPSRTPPSTRMRVSLSDPFSPPLLFFFAAPPLSVRLKVVTKPSSPPSSSERCCAILLDQRRTSLSSSCVWRWCRSCLQKLQTGIVAVSSLSLRRVRVSNYVEFEFRVRVRVSSNFSRLVEINFRRVT